MTDAARIILGIDPGTASTGFGVVAQRGNRLEAVAFGVVRTTADLELHERLDLIFEQIGALVQRYHPSEAAVESLFFNVNVRTALAVGQARGVALLACSRGGCQVFEYTPQEVKQSVVGYGKAEKSQVQEMVRVLLGLGEIPKPDHAADALGIAICHAHGRALRIRAKLALSSRGRPGTSP
ncbi:MAG: crossover junction endodeoxyribonuclease RuvC [Thermoleophilia bacterium]